MKRWRKSQKMVEEYMKKRISYTTSKRNPLRWLAVLMAAAAAVGYVVNAFCGRGGGNGCAWTWLRVVLPAAAALYFAWQLGRNGRDRLYRLSLPYWLLVIGEIFLLFRLGLAWYWIVLLIPAQLVLAFALHRCLSGRLPQDWLIIVISGLFLSWVLWSRRLLPEAPDCAARWLGLAPDLLLGGAYIPLCFAMKRVEDGKYHPTWGDRADGRRVRSLSPISAVGAYIMPERNQANVLFQDSLEITGLERYIHKKRENGYPDFGITETLLAAYVRTASRFPALNRFLSGQRIYQRDEEILFCMAVKKEMTQTSPDTIIKLHLRTGDSVEEVYRKYHEAVAEVRKSTELDSDLDGLTAVFQLIPGVLLKFVIWLLKFLDYFGVMPRLILELSPFHGSVFFTSMGSLGIPPVFHHLYNFGNLPIFMAFGRKYRRTELDPDGNPVHKKYLDYTFNVDERTVDGFYYATTIKYFHKLLLHPERLDEEEMEINRDIP